MIVRPLTFDEAARSLWPALRLLAASTKLRPQTALRDVRVWLGAVRAYDDRRAPLKPPCSPYSTKEVLDWLHAIWRDLNRADSGDAHAWRRELVQTIKSQNHAESERVALISAVDYLHRLAGAIRAAEASDGLGPVEIPAVSHEGVQGAYRKLIGLAVSDLPVWLEGEKGTELEWAAGLVQRLRDGKDHTPVLWPAGAEAEADLTELTAEWEHTSSRTGSAGLLIFDAHRASPRIHVALHRHLVERLSRTEPFRLMIATEPIDLAGEDLPESSLELCSFLEPMRVTFGPPAQSNRRYSGPCRILPACEPASEPDFSMRGRDPRCAHELPLARQHCGIAGGNGMARASATFRSDQARGSSQAFPAALTGRRKDGRNS